MPVVKIDPYGLFEIQLEERGYYRTTWKVKLLEGSWPEDEVIINMLDAPNFGGCLQAQIPEKNIKFYDIWID